MKKLIETKFSMNIIADIKEYNKTIQFKEKNPLRLAGINSQINLFIFFENYI